MHLVLMINDQGTVWFEPSLALLKIWLAKILVKVLLAYELANFGKKQTRVGKVAFACQKVGNHQNEDQAATSFICLPILRL